MKRRDFLLSGVGILACGKLLAGEKVKPKIYYATEKVKIVDEYETTLERILTKYNNINRIKKDKFTELFFQYTCEYYDEYVLTFMECRNGVMYYLGQEFISKELNFSILSDSLTYRFNEGGIKLRLVKDDRSRLG